MIFLACEPGQYCKDTGSPTTSGDCMEGYYCIINSTKSNPTDGVTGNECPIGHYCPKGSPAPIACSNGTFMNITGVLLIKTFYDHSYSKIVKLYFDLILS